MNLMAWNTLSAVLLFFGSHGGACLCSISVLKESRSYAIFIVYEMLMVKMHQTLVIIWEGMLIEHVSNFDIVYFSSQTN